MDHPPSDKQIQDIELIQWTADHGASQTRDELAIEEPLEIRIRGKSVCVTMRTPGHDEQLAIGFLIGEGLIQHRDDIARIAPCERTADGNIINVFLASNVEVDFKKLTRHVFASSSCGLCGKASIDAIYGSFPPITSSASVTTHHLQSMPDQLRQAQTIFGRTGGLHAAALFDTNAALLAVREDVGRHNAVDKILGWALQNRQPLEDCVLLVSGRASFEIVQKSLAGHIPIIAAVSAPSSLAVELARECGQTLVGFLRPGRMNLYTHTQRVV